MAVGDTHVFPGFLTPVVTQLFFPKPPTTFLACFCRGERRYAEKKRRLNGGTNSQPPGHESDTLASEPPERGTLGKGEIAHYEQFLLFPFGELSTIFIKFAIVVCKLFQFRSLNYLFGKGLSFA